MSGFRIANTNFTPTPKTKPVKSKDYLSFIHLLPCVVSGRYGVQAAHLSMASPRHGHYGRGKGRKAPDRFCLPLAPEEHDRQHRIGEQAYWSGRDPHFLCLVIWGLFSDMGEDAAPFATGVINQWRAEAPPVLKETR